MALEMAGGLEVDHVFVLGLRAGAAGLARARLRAGPDALLHEQLPPDDEAAPALASAPAAVRRDHARARAGRAGLRRGRASAAPRSPPLPVVEAAREALGAEWLELTEDLFGPAEALHSTYRLLRDELMDGTQRAAGRLAELRLDTDLDISHAVVRYLELLKLAALIAAAPMATGRASATRCATSTCGSSRRVTADQREIFASSPLDELPARRRARRAPPGARDRCSRRAVARALPADARRRA